MRNLILRIAILLMALNFNTYTAQAESLMGGIVVLVQNGFNTNEVIEFPTCATQPGTKNVITVLDNFGKVIYTRTFEGEAVTLSNLNKGNYTILVQVGLCTAGKTFTKN